MHKKLYLCFFACLFSSTYAFATLPYETVLQQIEANNITLKQKKQQLNTLLLKAKTGLYPSNPDLSYGYYWNNTNEDVRHGFALAQTLNFPTYYFEVSKLAKTKIEQAQLNYATQRLEVRLQTRLLCDLIVYQNALKALYDSEDKNCRKQRAIALQKKYAALFLKDSCTALERNRIEVNLGRVNNKVANINTTLHTYLLQLKELNGGKEINFTQQTFTPQLMPEHFETWIETELERNPALAYLQSSIDVSKRAVAVEKANAWPDFTLSYSQTYALSNLGDDVLSQSTGLRVELPLWENKNKIRAAQSFAQETEITLQEAKLNYYTELAVLFNKAKKLEYGVWYYGGVLKQFSDIDLIYNSLEQGEISVFEYCSQMDYFYAGEIEQLDLQRNLALTLTKLYKTEL